MEFKYYSKDDLIRVSAKDDIFPTFKLSYIGDIRKIKGKYRFSTGASGFLTSKHLEGISKKLIELNKE